MVEWLTVADAGRELGITAAGARWLADTGRLRVGATTPSGVRLFRRADVEKCKSERKTQTARARMPRDEEARDREG